MRRLPAILVILVLSLGCGWFGDAGAYSATEYFGYLQGIYDQHDDKLDEYLLAELAAFCQVFPESPEAPEAMYLMAKVHLDQNDEHDALAVLAKNLFLYPVSPVHDRVMEDTRALLAEEKDFRDRQEELLNLIRGAAEGGDPADRRFNFLAFLHQLQEDKLERFTLGEYDHFVRWYAGDPRVEGVLVWIAELYAEGGKDREAVASHQKLEGLFPQSGRIPHVMVQRAILVDDELGQHDHAAEVLTEVIETYPEAAAAALFFRGGIKADHDKDYDGAKADYRRLVTGWPGHEQAVPALFAMAEISAKKQKAYRTAVGTYDEIVESYPGDRRGIEALEEAAEVQLRKLDEVGPAAERYARIATLFPDFEEAGKMLLKAAEICEDKLKDYGKAIEYYQRVVTEYPDTDESRKAAKRIAKIRENQG